MDDQLHLLTGVYALNAVGDDERHQFEHDLPFGHPTAEEARELSETAALLAALTTPVAPPPALRARLLAQIATVPQVEPVVDPDAAPSPGSTVSAPVPPAPPSAPPPRLADAGDDAPVIRIDAARRRRFPAGARWFAAAAAVVVVALGGAGLWVAHAQQQRDEAQHELATLQGSPAAVLSRILAAPDATVQKASVPGGGDILLVHSQGAALGGVMTVGLRQPEAGKTYELWLITASGAAKPAGLVPTGDRTTWNELSGGVGDAKYLGVTVEPAGGSAQPTTKPIVLQAIT